MAYKKRTSPDGRPLWMPVWVAERVADTSHLSAFELGCLHRLELSYWRSGPPRDCEDTLARICGCSVVDFRRVRSSLEMFFDLGGEQWISPRIDQELAEAYRIITLNKRRTAAATSARVGKRNVQRNVQRNDERESNVTGNQLQVNSKTPLAKGGFGFISPDDPEVEAAISASESMQLGVRHEL